MSEGLITGNRGNLESLIKSIFSVSLFNFDQISLSQQLFGIDFPFGSQLNSFTDFNSNSKRSKIAEASNFLIFVSLENSSSLKIFCRFSGKSVKTNLDE